MDGREQLRKYLEQRRELGERELVLDSLSADEAFRLIAGAHGTLGRAASPTPEVQPSAEPTQLAPTEDWRAALRAAGVTPPAGRETPRGAPVDKPVGQESLYQKSIDIEAAKPDAGPSDQAADLSTIPRGIAVGAAGEALFAGGIGQLQSLAEIAQGVASCTRCQLSAKALNPVPGEGNPHAKLVLVGEAPGATEDETGRPFVGAAGQLLTKILAAIDLAREDVFICNVLKHRPPNNRNPEPDEITACSPYLVRQIALIQPNVIIALGKFAAQTLLSSKLSIDKLRGRIHRYYGVPLIVTYHPAALLRNPSWKRPTWEDVKLARRILDSPGATRDA